MVFVNFLLNLDPLLAMIDGDRYLAIVLSGDRGCNEMIPKAKK